MSRCFQARVKPVASGTACHDNPFSPAGRGRQQGDKQHAAADRFERQANLAAEQISRAGSATHPDIRLAPAAPLPALITDQQLSTLAPVKPAGPLSEREQYAHRIASVGGAPLHPQYREPMEARFQRDFSQVRVHVDGQAATAAGAIQARAYTVGSHIVFGRGEYAPRLASGKELLAHELTHVVQQSGRAETLRCKPKKDKKSDEASEQNTAELIPDRQETRPATEQERREFVDDVRLFLENASDAYQYLEPDEARLATILTGLYRTITKTLAIVDAYFEGDPALTDPLQQAYGAAVTVLVKKASASTGKTVRQLYQDNLDQVHESAWPDLATTGALAHELAGALPVAERSKLTMLTSDVDLPGVDELFDTVGGKVTIPTPDKSIVTYAADIQEPLKHGLKNVAGSLIPDPLKLNSTLTMVLNLEPYGGDYSSYRFTYVEHKASKPGQEDSQEILIEFLGNVGLEGFRESEAEQQQERFDSFNFTADRGWSSEEYQSLLVTMGQIADELLTPVEGLTFQRDEVHPTRPSVGGDYNAKTHTITIYDKAFKPAMSRFGTPGTDVGLQNRPVNVITHEIGHAIDLLPIRLAWNHLEQQREVLQTAFAEYETSPGSGEYAFPGEEQARFNQLKAKLVQAQQQYTSARARSGARDIKVGGVFETSDNRAGGQNNEFRKAARKDGARFPTDYPNPRDWWQEFFAETFALYINNPVVLRQSRPEIYAYFAKNF